MGHMVNRGEMENMVNVANMFNMVNIALILVQIDPFDHVVPGP